MGTLPRPAAGLMSVPLVASERSSMPCTRRNSSSPVSACAPSWAITARCRTTSQPALKVTTPNVARPMTVAVEPGSSAGGMATILRLELSCLVVYVSWACGEQAGQDAGHGAVEQVCGWSGGLIGRGGGRGRVRAGRGCRAQVAARCFLPLGGVLAGALAVQFGLREHPDGTGKQADRLQPGRAGQAGRGQRGEHVVDEGEGVRPGKREGGGALEQPRVPAVDAQGLTGQAEQVGDRVPARESRVAELAVDV